MAQSPQAFPPPAVAPSFTPLFTDTPVQLDGMLTEAAWQNTPFINNFFKREPRQGAACLYQTSVRVLYDKKNLYFGVFCADSLGKKGIRVQDYRRDFMSSNNDHFYIQLDPQNLKRYCVSFQATPLGTQRDLQVFDDSFIDVDWDALWRVRTHVTDSGYYAEFAIPFKSLRYDRSTIADSTSWGITFGRMARRDYEVSSYPPIPQAYSSYRMTYAGALKGLTLPPPSLNLRLQPYALYQYSRNTDAAGQKKSAHDMKMGGELKWAVNPHTVVDLTFNTDFAQADVDRAINNLTRFNVLFPERRQFFLENSGVYAGADVMGVKPFFSRTIGLSDTQFNADPVAIDAGLRYTDRTQKRSWAGMYVHQRGTDFQSAANFGVLRYLKNYGNQNTVGAMLTHKLDERDTEQGFAEKNNTTLTVDGLIRPNNSWTVQYLGSASRDNTNDSVGFASSLRVSRDLPQWYYGWNTKFVDKKYQPGMGFVFAHNTMHHNPGAYYIWRPKKWNFIRRWDPGLFINYYQNADDLGFQQADLYLFPVYILFRDGSFLEYAITPSWQHINFDFSILGLPIAQGNYEYVRHRIDYQTDQSRKYAFTGSYEWGSYYNGILHTAKAGMRIAPIPNIALQINYEYNELAQMGEADEYTDTSLITGELRLAVNPNLLASVFYQYNSFYAQGRWNARASWQFAPLSFLYVVFNESNVRHSPVQQQSLISKITYLKQF